MRGRKMTHNKHSGRHHPAEAAESAATDEHGPELAEASREPGQTQARLAELERELAEKAELISQKEQALAEREKEAAELKDKYLRVLAESDNIRKRVRQQADETVRLQREDLLRELLSIIDNLERAVAAASGGGNGKPIVEGVEMVLRSMLDLLKSHGVTPLSAVGERFDPLLHEAVDHVENPGLEPNTVIDEFMRGYRIGDRLLRPARVSVAKQPTPQGSQGGDEQETGGGGGEA